VTSQGDVLAGSISLNSHKHTYETPAHPDGPGDTSGPT
jgi:hypothetical protein